MRYQIMNIIKKSKIIASNVRPFAREYATRKRHQREAEDRFNSLGEQSNNDVLSRESKMYIARGQTNESQTALARELADEFTQTYTDPEDYAAIYDEMYGQLRNINKEDNLGLSGSEMDFIVQDAMKLIKFNVGATRKLSKKSKVTAAYDRDWYFGKEEADQFGDLIVKKLAGKTVSKRRDTAEEPGGLIFEADRLGIDMWDLLRALEGMCNDGRAREIDDSTYKVFADTRGAKYVQSADKALDYADSDSVADVLLEDACRALGCTTKDWNYKNYLGETETHVLLVDRKGKTIGMLDLHYPEDIMRIYEESGRDEESAFGEVLKYLKDEINMFSEAYDDNVITL